MAFTAPGVRLHPPPPRAQRRRCVCQQASPAGARPAPARRFEAVGWPAVERMSAQLARLAAPERFDVVVAVTRGGLVPATLVCEAFELRNVLSATVIFYTDHGDQFFGMTEPRFLSFPSLDELAGRRVLVVDDVWDSGRTAQAVRNRVQRANPEIVKVAVLHYKPAMNIFKGVEPDFFANTTDNWILYPWEKASPHVEKCFPKDALIDDVAGASH